MLINKLKKAGIVDENNEKIVIYGLKKIKILFEDFVYVIICGVILGNIAVAALYEVTYMMLRVYAGGYHATTERRCQCLSFVSVNISLWFVFYDLILIEIIDILLVCSLLLIFRLVPVESTNKKLSQRENKIYRIRSLAIVIVEVCVYVICVCLGQTLYAKAIGSAIIVVAIGLKPNLLKTAKYGKVN